MEPNAQPDSGPTGHQSRGRYRYRSVFWPIVLVAVGGVWLLANFDLVSTAQLSTLTRLWPILLIGIGVDLLVGHRSLPLGAAVGVVTVGIVVVLMAVGPSLGWAQDTTVKQQTFTTPVGQATRARVELGLSGYRVSVHGLDGSAGTERPLISAACSYVGAVDFAAAGDTEKTVALKAAGGFWGWRWFGGEADHSWDVGLDPQVPIDLTIDSSSGKKTIDLTRVTLAGLACNVSSGEVDVDLPVFSAAVPLAFDVSSGDLRVHAASGGALELSLDVSSGDADVSLAEGSGATVRVHVSSGSVTVNVPASLPLRVDVQDISSGEVKLPSGLELVGGRKGEEGVWQSAGFVAGPQSVNVVVESISSGSITVRQGG